MNINGRDITAADLIEQIDMLHSGWCNIMYKHISTDFINRIAFTKHSN